MTNPNDMEVIDELPEQCIICGTLIEDLDDDDIREIGDKKICIGCFNEGWFEKCNICGEYVFETDAIYDELSDRCYCKKCKIRSIDE